MDRAPGTPERSGRRTDGRWLSQTVRCVVPDDDEAVALAEEALGASGEPLWAAAPAGTTRATRGR